MSEKRERQQLYRSESIKLLYNNAIPGIIITFIAATTLTFTFIDNGHRTWKLMWWGVLCAVLALRLVDTWSWRRCREKHRRVRAFHLRFSCGCLITAALWSSYFCLFERFFTLEEFTSTVVILSAMVGGAANVLSGSVMLASCYTLIVLMPWSLMLLDSPLDYKRSIGFLGLFFTATMIFSAIRSAKYIRQAIALKYKNQRLVDRMEDTIRERTQKIYEISYKDALTGLSNRVAFQNEADDMVFRYKRGEIPGFSLFFIDLDGFKSINDALGHDVGDRVLLSFSNRLAAFQDSGTLICRWGGDEFIYCTPQTDHAALRNLAAQMVKSFNQPFYLREQEITLSATIGIAICPEHSTNLTRLIQIADIAMYAQKGKQPERVLFYNHQLEENLRSKVLLQEALNNALARHELRLVFQPIVDSRTREIRSFEALLRWKRGTQIIDPSVFIPIAERSGQIVNIGYWVLEEACKTLAHLPAEETAISVNVSVIQFQDQQFLAKVNRLLETYHINPARLHIEVTESLFHSGQSDLTDKILWLQRQGIKISIDDFGTGYSSLSVIQNLNIDFVKIDRSFIHKIEDKGLAIVEAVMNMSHSLNFRIIAEGVESEEQAQLLRRCGIHYMQGFLFSQPVEMVDVFRLSGSRLLHPAPESVL